METPVSLIEFLTYLRDFFPGEKWQFDGHFITGGKIEIPEMWNGEYYLIENSRRNNGIHVYGNSDLLPETFSGIVTRLDIPLVLLEKWHEINQWCVLHREQIHSPYQSESFGGYVYEKNAGGSSWKAVFAEDLKPWRKL